MVAGTLATKAAAPRDAMRWYSAPRPAGRFGHARVSHGRRRGMVSAMIDFSGDRVVITGAAGGVGRALVETFAACGAAVVACDLPTADFAGLPVAEIHEFDLLDGAAMRRSVAAIVSGGAPAAVVSNAGWTQAETLADVTPEGLFHELDLNFRSAAALSLAFLPCKRDRPDRAARRCHFESLPSRHLRIEFSYPNERPRRE